MRRLYSLGVRVYRFGIFLYSLFNQKARQWIEGRKNWKDRLRDANIKGAIWIHCASLGEFEQGRPVLEGIKKSHPEKKLLLTFFSPSGYEIRKNYEIADCVCYIPLDTMSNAQTFIDLVQPEFAIFVKYEVWHNFFGELSKRGIAHFIISAIFRADQVYFKNYGAWFRKTLTRTTKIFTQDHRSLELLQDYAISNAEYAGDTRFDRVFEIAQKSKRLQRAEQFSGSHLTLVAGSTWAADEKFLSEALKEFPDIKLIIAPHEVDQKHIRALQNQFPASTLWSDSETEIKNCETLIIDTIGILSSLYASGNVAYVGGGFGSGIHNTLEPASFGIPVLFGPNFSKFKEAGDLISAGGAFSFSNSTGLKKLLSKMHTNENYRKNAGKIAKQYVEENRGAAQKILDEIID